MINIIPGRKFGVELENNECFVFYSHLDCALHCAIDEGNHRLVIVLKTCAHSLLMIVSGVVSKRVLIYSAVGLLLCSYHHRIV